MIRFIAVDDEEIALEGLVDTIKEAKPQVAVEGFNVPDDALEYARKYDIHTAFLDIEMINKDGIDLAKDLQAINPNINIIFVTGYSQYASEAFGLHASGYISKPVTLEKLSNELAHLRNPINEDELGDERGLRVKCFGNFEVWINGVVAEFRYQKTKEMLAYLIDRRGAFCTNGELEAVLWEDGNHDSYLRKLKSDLSTTLEEAGCNDVIIKSRGNIGVFTDNVNCDYFNYLNGSQELADQFNGEYMTQYSWGEFTTSFLMSKTLK